MKFLEFVGKVFNFPITLLFMIAYIIFMLVVPFEFALLVIIFGGYFIFLILSSGDIKKRKRFYYGILIWIWILVIVNIGVYKYRHYEPINKIIHVFPSNEYTFLEKSNDKDIDVMIIKNHKIVYTVTMSPKDYIEFKTYKGDFKIVIAEKNTRLHQIPNNNHKILSINEKDETPETPKTEKDK